MFGDLLNRISGVAKATNGWADSLLGGNQPTPSQSGPGFAGGGTSGAGGGGSFGGGEPAPPPAPTSNNFTGSGSGGGAAYNPNTDPGAIAARRNEINGLRPGLDSLYAQIYGGIDNVAREKSGNINTQAGQQRDSMQKQYLGDQNQIGANFTGRNTYDSSYRANQQDQGTNLYNQNVTNYNNDVNNQLGAVGQWLNQQKTQYQGDQANYNKTFDAAGQAGDVNSLLGLKGQIEGHLQELNNALAGLKTNPENIAALSKIAPQYDTSALQSKIAALVASTAPADAKQAVLQGYFNTAGLNANDQAYWKSYYANQLTPNTQSPQDDPTKLVKQVV